MSIKKKTANIIYVLIFLGIISGLFFRFYQADQRQNIQSRAEIQQQMLTTLDGMIKGHQNATLSHRLELQSTTAGGNSNYVAIWYDLLEFDNYFLNLLNSIASKEESDPIVNTKRQQLQARIEATLSSVEATDPPLVPALTVLISSIMQKSSKIFEHVADLQIDQLLTTTQEKEKLLQEAKKIIESKSAAN
jgi:hypothetical protein